MTATVHNVHERVLPVPAAYVGRLVDRIGAADDPLWPAPTWAPMRFDRPLAVGADGGHGRIRYHVTAYEPGRRIEWAFHARTGVVGSHTLEVDERGPRACVLRHRMSVELLGRMWLIWPAFVRGCHDAVIEHLLDNAERATTGAVAQPIRYPWRARLAVRVGNARVRTVPVPTAATLLGGSVREPDLADAYALRVPPGTTTDPQEWADAIFRNPPRVVVALLHLRDWLVTPFGIERGDSSAFDTICRTGHEVLLGTDAGHLTFRTAVLVERDSDGLTVTLATLAAHRSRAGRAYLMVVGLVHPWVVRAMLRRAGRIAVAPWRSVAVSPSSGGIRPGGQG